MAQRTLIYYGNAMLRQKAKKIHRFDASLLQLVQDMFETMHAHDGIGLAAPQIGLSLRVFVVECTERETGKHFKVAMTNPELMKAEGEQRGVDACLSIPGYYGVNVRRAAHVVVKGQDMRGKFIRIGADETVQTCPFLIYSEHDSRRDNSIIRSTTQGSLEATG